MRFWNPNHKGKSDGMTPAGWILTGLVAVALVAVYVLGGGV